ncbi:MAG: CapA family protein [Deltaproteobacteria bacterium]|nr:CapA family protein [Deltaproteobacteria bacterium]
MGTRTWLAFTALWLGCGQPVSRAEPADPPFVESVSTETGTETGTGPVAPVSLWVTGDILLSEAVRDSMNATEDPAGAYANVLAPIARLWNADEGAFVLVNLETPVAATRRRAIDAAEPVERGLTPVYLQGPPWLPEALARAGVDGVMLANNHALDQEREGLRETIEAARSVGLVVTGAGTYPRHRWPIVLGGDEPETSLAVLTFYDAHAKGWVDPGESARSFLDDDAVDLVAATTERHRVVAVVHFVGELREEPMQRWRTRVQRLIDAGASAVIAHGTHVPMAVERIDGVPVAWGLGNFVADMGRQANPRSSRGRRLPKIRSPKTREGLVARVALEPDGELSLSFLPTWSGDDRFIRWHSTLPGEEVQFELTPLSACGPALTLPEEWAEPWRSELAGWIDERRDHLVEVSGLAPVDCVPGEPTWLRMADAP